MDFSAAFDQTLIKFGIRARDIAERSGVPENTISRFRKGKQDIKATSLTRLLEALPQEARYHLYLNMLIEEMDQVTMANMLTVIAHRLKGDDNNSANSTAQTPEPVLSLR